MPASTAKLVTASPAIRAFDGFGPKIGFVSRQPGQVASDVVNPSAALAAAKTPKTAKYLRSITRSVFGFGASGFSSAHEQVEIRKNAKSSV